MSPSGAEFIRQVKSQIDRSRSRRGPRRCSATASRSSTCARPRSSRPATCPAPGTCRAGFLETRIEGAVPDRSQRVILYCASGNRSALAASTLPRSSATSTSSR